MTNMRDQVSGGAARGAARQSAPDPAGAPDRSACRIAVVVPCYRARGTVLGVLAAMPAEVETIICVDDGCPEQTGRHMAEACDDPRVEILTLATNRGVGGAMAAGYRAALDAGADIVVKIDSDGQMDPAQLHRFTEPIAAGRADYTKGNRFYFPSALLGMPGTRLFGNAGLSFASKLSTGYWQIFDVNNGYTAIHAAVLSHVDLDRLDCGYFFESEMLFRLNTLRAVVVDIPMESQYGDEKSHLAPLRIAGKFAWGHFVNFHKRLIYNYFLRDFQVASVEWIVGPLLVAFGVVYGLVNWIEAAQTATATPAGTIMLAALPIIIGVQMTLNALSFDISNQPRDVVHPLLADDGNPHSTPTGGAAQDGGRR